MKIGNTTLIPQNVATDNARKVAIFDSNDNLVCTMDLGHLKMPSVGIKLYSFGEIADVHVYADDDSSYKSDTTAGEDLANALNYFRANADFACIDGDLTSWGTTADLKKIKSILDENSGDMKVYPIGGNHEYWAAYYRDETVDISSVISTYTGYPLNYTITKGNDVFIFCGPSAIENQFSQATLQWLYEVLEENRNRRTFLHIHPPLKGSQYCGDSTGIINAVDMIGRYGQQVFISLLMHYKNVIYIHAHTHTMLQMQNYTQTLNPPLPANYDFACGVHSIHVPSLAFPRDISSGSRVEMYAESQGYLIDVYENHIVVRGVDFVKGEFIPIAQYCLDTTLQTVEAGTFIDSAGIITT